MNGPNAILRRYGKSMNDVFAIKENFFSENDKLLLNQKKFTEIYRKQAKREMCKICGEKIPATLLFANHGTKFYLCEKCGHLNGEFNDGEEYSHALYETGLYGGDYREPSKEGFTRRLDAIYTPKARFLVDMLRQIEPAYSNYQFLDIGAGVGYMVGAIDRFGLAVKGIEVDSNQVEYANRMLNKAVLERQAIKQVTESIKNTKAQVLTFINVLEHITNLQETFDAVKANASIKYIFFSVPKLGFTCALESIFTEVYPRHIGGGGGHTHLFTKESLNWIYQNWGFKSVAEWHFGTDIMDLYRMIVVMLGKNNANEKFVNIVSKMFQEQTDAIQQILDKTDFASDIHVLVMVH
jgi:hypothetical protein